MVKNSRAVAALALVAVSLLARPVWANHGGEGGFLLIVLGVALLSLLGLVSLVASLVLIAKVRRGGASERARHWCRGLAFINAVLAILTLVPLVVDPRSPDSPKAIPAGVALLVLSWIGLRVSRPKSG